MKNFAKILMVSLIFTFASQANANCKHFYPGTNQVMKDCSNKIYYRNGKLAYDSMLGTLYAGNGAIIRKGTSGEIKTAYGNVIVEGLTKRMFYPNGNLYVRPHTGEVFYPNGRPLMRKNFNDNLYTMGGYFSPAAIVQKIDLGDGLIRMVMRIWEKSIEYKLLVDLGDGENEIEWTATTHPNGSIGLPVNQMFRNWKLVQKGF